jgi:two-component system sensor histidine kinase UhpB
LPLFWQVCLINGLVFALGTLALVLAPVTVSERAAASEAVVLAVGLSLMLLLNGLLLLRSLHPIDRIIAELEDAHRAERAASNAKALAAQEAERHRIAQELHDEVGQSLTVVLLGLKGLESRVSPEVAEELASIRETTRDSLDDVKAVVSRLRPGVLEDLGLHSALNALCTDLAALTGVEVTRTFGRGLPALSAEQELVIYRVAQEATTNIARHAEARTAALSLTRVGDAVVLEVSDDGKGRGPLSPGTGLIGMQERALLIGATLTVGARPSHGVTVRLEVAAP